jgi:NAD(P)-dependent dehydrogenase (short-subunit alcohol dehydrogenase family)
MSAMNSARWTAADIPVQHGRIALVTGANSGIGLAAATALAASGATVVLACRDAGRAQDAAAQITARVPGARPEIVSLDLSSLASVREAAAQVRSGHDRLDLLINNAGVMYTPRSATKDGFELQFGTNHLGHFALTGLLLDLLLAAPGARVVTVSSFAHRAGRIDFADLQSARRYRRAAAYAQSKLANLLFAFELQRRLAAAGTRASSLAAHPGYTQTDLLRHLPPVVQAGARAARLGQSPEMGALPVLRAATDPAASGGEFFGPRGLTQLAGYPKRVAPAARARDAAVAGQLWAESERLTGVSYLS